MHRNQRQLRDKRRDFDPHLPARRSSFALLRTGLGSVSLATNASGAKVSVMRYTPYGEIRYGDAPTDFRFTGQRHEAGLGLYDYGARYYDPALGRFISPDTIIPDPANPQSLNRYAYTLNNPLRYTDPSGHYEDDEILTWLKEQYLDTWESIWQTWQQDAVWMDWLHTAQTGYLGAYLKSDGNIQWFMFGPMLLGGTLASFNDTEVNGTFSLVDLYAGMWATGILLKNNTGGFEVLPTDKTGRPLHISDYTAIDNVGEARLGHYKRQGVITLASWGIGKLVPLTFSPLAREGWRVFLNGPGIAEALAVVGWVVSTEEDFLLPNDGCSVGDQAVYFEVLWGHQYILPNGKPAWFWWGGK